MNDADAELRARTARWMEIAEPGELVEAICRLFDERGSSNYDEAVTQTVHALQSAELAAEAHASPALIAAALLHDIGHLLLGEWEHRPDFLDRDLHHEDVAARFLSNWFDADVTEPIRLHVDAKRFLCAVEADYAAGLSPASVRSLNVQGGPMDDGEVAEFRASGFADPATELRRWDDLAKDVDRPVGAIRDHTLLLTTLVTMPERPTT